MGARRALPLPGAGPGCYHGRMVYRHTRGCPVCGGTFTSYRTRTYNYERCARCLGIWMSMPVLRAMVASMVEGARPFFQERAGGESRMCPDCQTPMSRADLFGVPVEVCTAREHGVWFDKDELAQALERVGVEDPAPPEPPTSFTTLLADFFRR